MFKTMILGCTLLSFLAGCGGAESGGGKAKSEAKSSLPESLWLASAPADAKDVLAVRESAKDGDDVTIVGKVGGAVSVFLERKALFSVVDLSLKDCYDMTDSCKTPWDYCCEEPTELRKGTATVEFQESGKLIATTAQGFHGLDHGKKVIIRGKARRDASGNLTIIATGVHVAG